MRERDSILALWREIAVGGGAAVLATVCRVRGSAYRRPGARMLLSEDGRTAGVISGGCLDGDLWRRAREVMDSDEAQAVRYDSSSPEDIVWGLGLGCRGQVDILVEPVVDLDWLKDGVTVAAVFEGSRLGTRVVDQAASRPRVLDLPGGRALVQTFHAPPTLWIFGTGADVAPVRRLALETGWSVQVVDLQSPNPDRPVQVAARHVAAEDVGSLDLDGNSACVIMTHRFVDDLEILEATLESDAGYIGVLGPRNRTDELLQALARRGIDPSPDTLSRLHAPIGLDIGAETPEEIALSILSEIHAVSAGRAGGFLRARLGPIHDVALPLLNNND